VLQTTAGKMIFCRWPEAAAFPEGAETRRDPRPVERGRNGREFRTGEIRRSDLERERRDSGERGLPPELLTEAPGGGGGNESRPAEVAMAPAPAPPAAEDLVPPPARSGEVPAAKAD
jgi:hypothetical protein